MTTLLNKINIKVVNNFFIIGVITIVFFQTLLSTGLFYDGAYDLFWMLYNNNFNFLEKSRLIAHFLYQFPAYLYIKSSFSSLNLLTQVFSFGLIWIHVISLLGCYFILPPNKKDLIFFPLFGFFIGPIIALGMAISVSLSVCSYIWLTAYIIYYSNFSNRIHKTLFFLIPLPLLLSHELVSYMAWPLIFLCWNKYKIEENLLNKCLIQFIIFYLFMSSIVQIFMILFHGTLTGTTYFPNFIKDFIHFKFLLNPEFNLPLVIVLFTLFLSFVQLYKEKTVYNFLKIGSFLIFFLLIFLIFVPIFGLENFFIPYDEYRIRSYPPIVALPFCLLFWLLHEKRNINIQKSSKFFLLSCIFCCFALLFSRIYFSYGFYKYQKGFSQQLGKCEGLLTGSEFKSYFKNIKFAHRYGLNWSDSWMHFEISLLYPKSNIINSAFLPPFSECMRLCQYEDIQLDCYKHCKQKQLFFSSNFVKPNKIKIFDTSDIRDNISKNVSVCKK